MEAPLTVTVRLMPGKRGRELMREIQESPYPDVAIASAVQEIVLAVEHPDFDLETPLAERREYLPPDAGMRLILLALGIREDVGK